MKKKVCWGCGKEGHYEGLELFPSGEVLYKLDKDEIIIDYINKEIGPQPVCVGCWIKLNEEMKRHIVANDRIGRELKMRLFGQDVLTRKQQKQYWAYLKEHKPFESYDDVQTTIGKLSTYYRVLPSLAPLFDN